MYNYTFASGSAGTTALATNPKGTLHSLVIGQCITPGMISVYDSVGALVSGSVVGSLINKVNIPTAALAPVTLVFDVRVNTGIYIVYENFAGVVTVVWKS